MVRTLVSPKARAAARALSATAVFTSPFNPGHVVVVVPVPLETTAGGIQFASASYSLALHGLISRSEFEGIVAALNAACERCRLNATAVHMLPAALLAPLLASKLAKLRSELTAVCRELSKEHSSRCVNLRVVDEPSCDDNECGILCFTLARMSPFRVNLEVMTTV